MNETEAKPSTTNASLSSSSPPTRSALVEFTMARIVEFYRDPGALFWVFGMPLLLAIALGLAFPNKPPDAVKLVVVDDATFFAAVLDAAHGFDTRTAPLDDA